MLKKGDEPIPGYRLARFLGEGGFGQVWEAEGEFGVRKALKFINVRGKIGLKEYRGIQRVKDIRQANLMQVTDIWMLDENWAVLQEDEVENLESTQPDLTKTVQISEFKEGGQRPAILIVGMTIGDQSLESLLAKQFAEHGKGIPLKELLSYMRDAAKGIDYLNMPKHPSPDGPVAIQHCDIKPANMMLVGNTVVICDFGLAHVLSDKNLTATGLAGAPAYISPEMLRNQTPTATTDQYSLACSYYHLRTALLPIHDTTSQAAMFAAHEAGKLDFSGIAGSRERSVLGRATHLNPKKRYESCGQFIEELSDAIKEDRRTGQLQKQNQAVRLKRLLKLGVVGILLAALGVSGFIYRQEIPAFVDSWISPNGNGKIPKQDDPATTFNIPELPGTGAESSEWTKKLKELEGALTKWKKLKDKKTYSKSLSSRLDEFLVRAETELNENPDPEIAAEIFDALRSASKEVNDADLGKTEKRTLWRRATLGLARAKTRTDSADGQSIESLINQLNSPEAPLTDFEQGVVTVLRVLVRFQPRDNLRAFFNEQVVDSLNQSLSSEWRNEPDYSEERSLLNGLLNDAVKFWDENEENDAELRGWAQDPRLNRIYEETFQVRNKLIEIREALFAATPPKSEELDEYRTSLERTESGLASPASQNRFSDALDADIKFLRAVLELRDRRSDFGGAVELLKDAVVDRSYQESVCRFLIDRLELEVPAGPLPTDLEPNPIKLTQERLDKIKASANVSLSARKKLVLRFLAVQTVEGLWQSSLDFAKTLEDCRRLREEITLKGPISSLVDACWLECTVATSNGVVDNITGGVIDQLIGELRPITHENDGIARNYCGYVLAFDAVTRLKKTSLEVLVGELQEGTERPILDTLTSRAFMKFNKRGQFMALRLVDATGELREKEQAPLANPAFSRANAGRVLRYLDLATQNFGVPSSDEEVRRNYVLGYFYAENPNFRQCLDLGSELQLDVGALGDGYLIFALASAAAKIKDPQAVSPKDALEHLGRFLEWQTRAGRSFGWRRLHECVLGPALEIARQYEPRLSGFNNVAGEFVIDQDITESERQSLASVYGAAAEMAEEDLEAPDILQINEGDIGVIRYRYFLYRAASELVQRQQVRYVIGQYWALLDWEESMAEQFDNKSKPLVELEMEALAKQAIYLAPQDSAANAIRGRQLVTDARKMVNAESKRSTFAMALDRLTRALVNPGRAKERLYILRSTTLVELSALLRIQNPKKREYLGNSIEDAQAVTAIKFRMNPDKAWIAKGHAEEDVAFYCNEDPRKNYMESIKSFEEALRLSKPPALAATWALGRCKYRFAEYLYGRVGQHPEDRDSAKIEVADAITKLNYVIGKTARDDLRAEAYLYLIQGVAVEAWLGNKRFEDDPRYTAAEKGLASAIAKLDAGIRPEFIYYWVDLMITLGRLDDARDRASLLLEPGSDDSLTGAWNYRFKVAKLVLDITEGDPNTVISKYLKIFTRTDPEAAEFRFRWLMLLPDRDWSELSTLQAQLDLKKPLNSKQQSKYQVLQKRLADNIGLAKSALRLAEESKWTKEQIHATLSLASLAYYRFRVSGDDSSLLENTEDALLESVNILKEKVLKKDLEEQLPWDHALIPESRSVTVKWCSQRYPEWFIGIRFKQHQEAKKEKDNKKSKTILDGTIEVLEDYVKTTRLPESVNDQLMNNIQWLKDQNAAPEESADRSKKSSSD